MISPKQAAEAIGVSLRTLRRLIAANQIVAIRVSERRIVITEEEVERYKAEGYRDPNRPPVVIPRASFACNVEYDPQYDPWRLEPWVQAGISPLDWYSANRHAIELSMDRISDSARDYDRYRGFDARSGAYFLYKDRYLLYVGKSIGINNRLQGHIHGYIPFNRYAFVEVVRGLEDVAEEFYIRRYRPPHNSMGVN